MKYIKLFIASSIIEFAQERASLSDFIRSLNDIYVPRGIYFQLTICEDLSNAVAKDRKQAEYNQTIREAQYFYILFGRTVHVFRPIHTYFDVKQCRLVALLTKQMYNNRTVHSSR